MPRRVIVLVVLHRVDEPRLPAPMPRRSIIGFESLPEVAAGWCGAARRQDFGLDAAAGRLVVDPAMPRVPCPGVLIVGRDVDVGRTGGILGILPSAMDRLPGSAFGSKPGYGGACVSSAIQTIGAPAAWEVASPVHLVRAAVDRAPPGSPSLAPQIERTHRSGSVSRPTLRIMADIFFSYKSDDRAAVEPLVRPLEAGGFTVWWDPSIVPGERYASAIPPRARRLPPASWWRGRAARSTRSGCRTRPASRATAACWCPSLDGVDPPLGFRQLQTVSLAGWQGQPDDPRVAHFLAGVRRLVNGSGKVEAAVVAPTPAPAATIPKAQPGKASGFRHTRTAVLVGVSTAAVLLIAGTLFFLTQRDQTASSYSPARPRGPAPVERSFRDCGAGCPVMVIVPTGSFLMGSVDREPQRGSDEGPQHEVTISKVSAIGKFPVTLDDWDACVAHRGCTDWPFVAKWGRGAQPVINVSWDDAKAYVAWLSRFTGKAYRLLSEAEREYVARAGTTTPFWWGATISTKRANYDGTQRYTDEPTGEFRQHAMPVDAFKPDPWGFYDVHGNAWEWVEDCYHDSYEGAPTDGSAWTTGDCNRRVLRGGSWASRRNLRSAARFRLAPAIRSKWYGFRVARTCEPSCTSDR